MSWIDLYNLLGIKDFIFFISPEKRTRPLEDTTAEMFLTPANHVIVSLAKGHTTGKATDDTKGYFLKSIQRLAAPPGQNVGVGTGGRCRAGRSRWSLVAKAPQQHRRGNPGSGWRCIGWRRRCGCRCGWQCPALRRQRAAARVGAQRAPAGPACIRPDL